MASSSDILATTRLSSKGQVVIPEEIRVAMGLEPGARFMVVQEGDSLMLKLISPPSKKEVQKLLAKARKQAKDAGLTEANIQEVIKEVRKR